MHAQSSVISVLYLSNQKRDKNSNQKQPEMVEYSRLDNRIRFDSTTQRDIVTSQRESFLLVQCFDEAVFSAEIKTKADNRAEFLDYGKKGDCHRQGSGFQPTWKTALVSVL